MKVKLIVTSFLLFTSFIACTTSSAQDANHSNYDEAKVPKYTLPDPLVMENGTKITSPSQWPARRKELLDLFQEHMHGKMPADKVNFTVEELEGPTVVFDGAATRRQVVLHFSKLVGDTVDKDAARIEMLIYLPAKATKPSPVFLGYNFDGNHTVDDDPAIRMLTAALRDNPEKGIVKNHATEKSRGSAKSRWPIREIIARGYGVVTACYQDNDPDVAKMFTRKLASLHIGTVTQEPALNAPAAVAMWAWGMSRMLDYCETIPEIDAKRVIAHGHSRLGKTSLWAGATDERFAITISNDSGEGGASITRRLFGERIMRINDANPHWFNGNYKKYNEKENDLPVDAHELIALCAPRPVYIASATEDKWADPRGEFLAAYHAGPVYKLLGQEPIASDRMPKPDQPIQTRVGYHVRTGKHDITLYDWTEYMNFADKHLGKP